MASDLIKVLSHLHDQRVEFIIVGGVAAVLHGGRRVTFDLDLIPRVDPDSWRAAVDALWTFGALTTAAFSSRHSRISST